jgi:hypothetical protein
MPKDLLKFLFQDSFLPTSDEAIAGVFEKMSEIEDIETKKGPLAKALKDIGHKGDVCVNDDGTAQICTDDPTVYSDLVAALDNPDGLLQLAELGWVPTFKNDDQDALAAKSHFVIGFICISEPTPSDGDKVEDLEKILKTMNEPNEDGPEGIGSDEKLAKVKTVDVKVPVPKNPKPAINDSLDEKKLVKPGDRVKVGTATDPVPDQPEKGTEGTVVEAYEGVVIVEFADGKTFGFGIEELDLLS